MRSIQQDSILCSNELNKKVSHRPPTVSDFDLVRMPFIHKRTLQPWSVHRSLTTRKYIATVVQSTEESLSSTGSNSNKVKHIQCPFVTERDARKFCTAYSPPQLVTTDSNNCMLCRITTTQPKRHCRNCGANICEGCTQRWGRCMVPKTYLSIQQQSSSTVRVCKSCDWFSNAFCMALLQGRFEDSLQLYERVSCKKRRKGQKYNVYGSQSESCLTIPVVRLAHF